MSVTRFWDPTGSRYGIPTYPWGLAPDGLATKTQLRARGLRPGGQDPVAQIMWRSHHSPDRSGIRVAYLYRIADAVPVRPMTPARWAAIERALAARRTCPACGQDRGYTIPTSLGMCPPCAGLDLAA